MTMTDTLRELLRNQFEAVFCTMGRCIEQCPDGQWDQSLANLKYCQAAFHALFFADYYLDTNNGEGLRRQEFHVAHPEFFRDYEELQDRPQTLLYDRSTTLAYVQHCREKAQRVINDESDEVLQGPSGFARRDFSRAELHAVNIRHLQHHAAQLMLKLRMETGDGVDWVGSGWMA